MDRFHFPSLVAALATTCAGVLLALTPASAALAADGDRSLVFRYGEADDDYERLGVALRFGPWWSWDRGGWHASLHPEIEVNRFRHSGPAAGPDGRYEIGGIGTLQLHYGNSRVRPYAELGLGVALFSNDQLGDKQFSTHFQFSQHVLLGVEIARRGFAGLQYAHYSNGDLEDPNDGIDLHEVVIGMRF